MNNDAHSITASCRALGLWAWVKGLAFLALVALAACDLPHDPNDTLGRVQNRVMRVGAIEAEPWVRWSEAGPSGIEVALIEAFAGELGARVEWLRGGESQVLLALSEERLDLAIGGLTRDNPRSDEVAFTRPYHRSHLAITAQPAAGGARIVTVPHQKRDGRSEEGPLVSQEFEHIMAVPTGRTHGCFASRRF